MNQQLIIDQEMTDLQALLDDIYSRVSNHEPGRAAEVILVLFQAFQQFQSLQLQEADCGAYN